MAYGFEHDIFSEDIPLIERFSDMDFMQDDSLISDDVLQESEYHPDDEERVIEMTRYLRQPVDRAFRV